MTRPDRHPAGRRPPPLGDTGRREVAGGGGPRGRAPVLVDLPREECLALLAGGVVGRVVYTEAAMPAAQPVTYCLDGDEVVFRTGDERTAAATRDHVVGFEVDAYDLPTRTGWSVVGVGMAYEVSDPARLAALLARVPRPLTREGSEAERTIAVPLQRLTGRLLSS